MREKHFGEIAARLSPGATLLDAERLTGGVSADVFRLDLRLADGATRSVVCRIHGETHSGHPADLEYRILQALHRKGIGVPEPLMVDTSGRTLAEPYLVIAFVEGSSRIPEGEEPARITAMAAALTRIHGTPVSDLTELPTRFDPLPEVFDFLPEDPEWTDLRAHLESLADTAYTGPPRLLHGDFWPENLLWQDGRIVAVLDWEDAALGDPLSDLAAARVELRYRYGKQAMRSFTRAYSENIPVDPERLALWQVYVAAAAQKFMGLWRLPPEREAHMRKEALASIREAGALLMGRSSARLTRTLR